MAEPKFNEELAAYEAKKAELLSICPGKFAVFKGSEFLGVYDTFASAYAAGLSKWGNVEFLIKLITSAERPEQYPALFVGLINASS